MEKKEEPLDEKSYVKSKMKWKEFELHPEIIEVLKAQGKTKPTRIQQQTLTITTNPDRKKFTLLIRSSNGSGKTLCYLLPILNSLKPGLPIAKDKNIPGKVLKDQIFLPQAIILVQTALLVQQIEDQLLKIQKEAAKLQKKPEILNFTIGRMDKDKHIPGDIIIAVPKSFDNRLERKNIKFDQTAFIAIDQVDQIFEQDPEVLKRILKANQDSKIKTHMLVCSATMKKEFREFFKQTCPSHLEINLNDILSKELGQTITLEGVANYTQTLNGKDKKFQYIIFELFKSLYDSKDRIKPKVFIFFNSVDDIEKFKNTFDTAASDLTSGNTYLKDITMGVIAGHRKLNGNKVDVSIEDRRKVITDFRNGNFKVLLATNIVARGIDIRDVCFVINVDAPRQQKSLQTISIDTYLHRVGRTGRYSDQGIALTLVDQKDEQGLMDSVKKVHKVEIKKLVSLEKLAQEIEHCIKLNSQIEEQKK